MFCARQNVYICAGRATGAALCFSYIDYYALLLMLLMEVESESILGSVFYLTCSLSFSPFVVAFTLTRMHFLHILISTISHHHTLSFHMGPLPDYRHLLKSIVVDAHFFATLRVMAVRTTERSGEKTTQNIAETVVTIYQM